MEQARETGYAEKLESRFRLEDKTEGARGDAGMRGLPHYVVVTSLLSEAPMAETGDMVVSMFRELNEKIDTRSNKVVSGLASIHPRLGKVEEAQKSLRNALSADAMMSRLVTGDFEGRIQTLGQ